MRLLVMATTRELTMSARVLLTVGAGLAARGDGVAFVCCKGSPAEAEIAKRFPDIPLRRLTGGSTMRRAYALRTMARQEGVEAVLVGTERDQLMAALAIGRRGGVVRRLCIGEQFTPGWRTRLASSRSSCLLMGDDVGANAHASAPVRAGIAWPRPLPAAGDPALQLGAAAPPAVIAIVAGISQVPAQHAAGAGALRAAARLTTRHPDLRVVLLGEIPTLQALRLHAASVGLADRISLMPLDALIETGPFSAAAVWVTATGDTGAVSTVSAMMRRIPTIVPRGFDIEALVAPRITGFVADDTDPAGSVAALAHLFADSEAHAAMGAVAASRAARLHGWDAMLGRTLEALVRAAGRRTKSRTAA